MATPHFSRHTLEFLERTSRQKRPDWLDRNRDDYESAVLEPLKHLAAHLKKKLTPQAQGYHFPQKGIGRLKRPSNRVGEYGGGLYKRWLSYSASRPSASRFEGNPNLFFMIDLDDPKEGILVAGGLYMPSSRQTRAIRDAIAADASAFDRLFASRAFARCFPGGFSDERKATRPPRGFDPNHPRLDWLKLQGFFVWRAYSKKEFYSPKFPTLVEHDWAQVLRLNEILDQVLSKTPQWRAPRLEPTSLSDRLDILPEKGASEARNTFDF